VAGERVEGPNVICHDWCFCTRKQDKEAIFKTLLKK